MSKEVEIVVVNATELKPDAKYLIAVDQMALTQENVADLANKLSRMGIRNAAAVMVDGNPNEVIKIVEQVEENDAA